MNLSGIDPIVFAKEFWPTNLFYREQIELIRSVHYYSDETYCVAGNMLGVSPPS